MFLNDLFKACPENEVAIISGDLEITYKELTENIGRFRSYLKAMGVEPGDNVGLYYKNSAEFIYAYFAVIGLGAVIVPFNRMLTAHEVEYIANDAKMKHIITMTALDLPDHYSQIVVPECIGQILATEIVEEASITRDMDDVTTIIYTSGTTGQPKGAMLTHQNLISNADSVVKHFDMSGEDKSLCVLPMFHSFAWTVCVLAPFKSASKVVVVENFMPKDVIRTIEDKQVTMVSGVPTMYTYYLALGSAENFKSVRAFISGGASLPVEILENFEKKMDKRIFEGYGLSEASPVVTINPLSLVKPGSIGTTLPNVQVKVVLDDGTEAPVGERGELLVKGPNVMKGYINLPEVTQKTIQDDWLHTGDVAYIDSEGYVFIVDRIKDIVIVSGLNVYPREIEELLYQFGGIVEASVIGVPDKKRGEVTVAYISIGENADFDDTALKDYLKENLAQFKLPKRIIKLDTLPKNATGKIMKKTLREMFVAG